MTRIEILTTIKAPLDIVLEEISNYTHTPVLHKDRLKSVKVQEQDGYVSIALWRLRILGFLSTARQNRH